MIINYYYVIVGDENIRGPGRTATASKIGYLLSGPSGEGSTTISSRATNLHVSLLVLKPILVDYLFNAIWFMCLTIIVSEKMGYKHTHSGGKLLNVSRKIWFSVSLEY